MRYQTFTFTSFNNFIKNATLFNQTVESRNIISMIMDVKFQTIWTIVGIFSNSKYDEVSINFLFVFF